jgi:hypothetical protein
MSTAASNAQRPLMPWRRDFVPEGRMQNVPQRVQLLFRRTAWQIRTSAATFAKALDFAWDS